VHGRANWTAQAFETGGLPYFEQPELFCAAYASFLEGAVGEHAPRNAAKLVSAGSAPNLTPKNA
jgi:hypothetical protein